MVPNEKSLEWSINNTVIKPKQDKIWCPIFRPKHLTKHWNYCDEFPTNQSSNYNNSVFAKQ